MCLKILIREKSKLRELGKLGSKHAVKFSKGMWHQMKIRERKGPSRGIIPKCAPHERSPCAPKFEERAHEEILHQERCARGVAWNLAKIFTSPIMRTKLRFILLFKPGQCRRPLRTRVRSRSRSIRAHAEQKIRTSDELDTLRRSRNSTVVLTANGEVQTNEEAQVYVHDLDLTRRNACCSIARCSCEWVSGRKPRLTREGKTIICKTDNFSPLVVPGLSTSSGSVSSSTSPPQNLSRREVEWLLETVCDPLQVHLQVQY